MRRYSKIKITEKQLILLKLRLAINFIDSDLFGKSQKTYRVKIINLRYPEHRIETVGRINNNIKFEVRSNERGGHKEAHFHITIRGEGSGVYKISDLSVLESSISSKAEKKVLEWARDNRQTLIDAWNKFHGYKITVD